MLRLSHCGSRPGGPKEAWVYGGPAPDLFVDTPDGGEERFAQVDFRDR